MSRSFKKFPVHGICCCKPKTLAFFKKHMTRVTRRWLNQKMDSGESLKDVPSNRFYARPIYDYQWRPDDGKRVADDIKYTRK